MKHQKTPAGLPPVGGEPIAPAYRPRQAEKAPPCQGGCPNCGEIYHKISKPPTVEGICDKCGTELTVRKDDQPDTIEERLRVFSAKTQPVLEYYETKGTLTRIDAMLTPQQVFSAILEALPDSDE